MEPQNAVRYMDVQRLLQLVKQVLDSISPPGSPLGAMTSFVVCDTMFVVPKCLSSVLHSC